MALISTDRLGGDPPADAARKQLISASLTEIRNARVSAQSEGLSGRFLGQQALEGRPSSSMRFDEWSWSMASLASVRYIVGGRSGAYERELERVRQIALEELQDAARQRGADAVVGIDLELRSARVE